MARLQEQPGGRQPAPRDLALVQAFVNTNDIEGRSDRAGRPESMRSWLVEQGLLEPREVIDEADFVRLLGVREALRDLALENNAGPANPDAVETLNRAARRGLAVDFATMSGVEPVGEGADRAIGRLLAVVLESMRAGSWRRMKACRRDVCRWIFYDHSRSRTSSWCSMAVCGNRTKTNAYRRRRTEIGGTET
jgi:predicted RNA-binding Zn ribbon-like protein